MVVCPLASNVPVIVVVLVVLPMLIEPPVPCRSDIRYETNSGVLIKRIAEDGRRSGRVAERIRACSGSNVCSIGASGIDRRSAKHRDGACCITDRNGSAAAAGIDRRIIIDAFATLMLVVPLIAFVEVPAVPNVLLVADTPNSFVVAP